MLSAHVLQPRHCDETIPEVIYIRFFSPFGILSPADPCWHLHDLTMTQLHLKYDRTEETTVGKEENNEGTEFEQRIRFYRPPWQKQNL